MADRVALGFAIAAWIAAIAFWLEVGLLFAITAIGLVLLAPNEEREDARRRNQAHPWRELR
jgi:hypothetical protein